MTTLALQPGLDLRNGDGTRLNFRKPLLGMDGCKGAMGLGEDEVLDEIALRNLRWAFDLRSPGSEKIFLRVWTRAVAAWGNPKIELPHKLAEVLRWLLPGRSEITGMVSGVELQRLGFGTSGHILNLIASGALESRGVGSHVDLTTGRRGPGGSPNVTRASVEKLLKERLL